MIKLKLNEEGEQEFIGTKEEWDAYDKLTAEEQDSLEIQNAEYCDMLEDQQFRWKGGQ